MAGGLLGPYTAQDCKSFQEFVLKHRTLLDEPSLTSEAIDEKGLVLCLSYRHKKFEDRSFDKDRMTFLEYRNWFRIPCAITGGNHKLYFWQDQKAKGVQPIATLTG